HSRTRQKLGAARILLRNLLARYGCAVVRSIRDCKSENDTVRFAGLSSSPYPATTRLANQSEIASVNKRQGRLRFRKRPSYLIGGKPNSVPQLFASKEAGR